MNSPRLSRGSRSFCDEDNRLEPRRRAKRGLTRLRARQAPAVHFQVVESVFAAVFLRPLSHRQPHRAPRKRSRIVGYSCHDRRMNDAEQSPRGSGEAIRVAVVDNEELFRQGLTMLLALEKGIEVVGEGGDGVAATELAAVTAPDVILMDVRMPKRSGIEACAAIREVAPTARIIMLTASDEEADLYDAIKNGAAGYLLKDSSIDEVAQAIRVVADGQSLISPSMAIKLLDEFKQLSRPDRDRGSTPQVTARELEVLKLVAQGLNNREIAKRLFISENTVKNHVRNILEKLQLHSRMDAVMYAMREKLIDIPDP